MTEIVAESLADSRSVAGRKATESPPVSLRRLRLFTVHSFDGRSRASKRARAIAAELVRALGGNVTTLQQQAVERAAMLTASQRSGSPSLALSPKCQELTSRAVADSTSCFSLKVVSCRRRAPTHAGIFFSAAGWLMMGRIKSSARRRRPFRKISDTSLPSHITTMVKPNIRDSTTTPELGSQ
jgi:hypothetical protein